MGYRDHQTRSKQRQPRDSPITFFIFYFTQKPVAMPPTTWTEDAVVALLMNVMRQTNPTLQGSNWKGIAETMEPVLGTNQNVLQ